MNLRVNLSCSLILGKSPFPGNHPKKGTVFKPRFPTTRISIRLDNLQTSFSWSIRFPPPRNSPLPLGSLCWAIDSLAFDCSMLGAFLASEPFSSHFKAGDLSFYWPGSVFFRIL